MMNESTFKMGRSKLRLFWLTLMLVCGTQLALAQTRTVKGIVVDATSGEPLVGVNLIVQGSTTGASTDLNGEFSIKISKGQTVKVSYVGYTDLILKATDFKGNDPLRVNLREAAGSLSELVVTGYGGTVSRAKVTNAIAKVDKEIFSKGVFSNPGQALSGAVSGLRVQQNSGRPGSTPSLVLRGGTNLDGSGSPLVIIDGQIRSLADINSNDIEDMQVLKDAGATAIYGARANNGVILITTKQGKEGVRSINFKATYGLNYIYDPHTFLDAGEYLYWQRKAIAETPWVPASMMAALDGKQPMGGGNELMGAGKDSRVWNVAYKDANNASLVGTDGWMEMVDPVNTNRSLIYKHTNPRDFNVVNPTKTQDYNLSMSGGNKNGTYYAGLGYNHAEGIPFSTFYKRFNFTFNGSYKVTDFITSTSNFNFVRANWKDMPKGDIGEYNFFGRISSLPPTARYVDDNGNLFLGKDLNDGNQQYQADKFHKDNESTKFSMVQSVDIRPFKGFSVKLTGNWFYETSLAEHFTRDYESSPGKWVRTRNSSASHARTFTQTYNAIANYKTSFLGKHGLDVMAGLEAFDTYYQYLGASGSGAALDDFMALGLTSDEAGKRNISSSHSRRRILSRFGRLNYDYDGKYLFSAVLRHDGYSTLLGNNRWGLFPGLSGGWVFTKESFVKDALPFLSFGKLRMSYGINGNASGIGAYELQGSYSSSLYSGRMAYSLHNLRNAGLRWERTRTFDIGLDLSFFENRLSTNITYYDRLTSDKYASLSLPTTTGFSSITNNNGEFSNRGLELDYTAKIISTKDLSWTVSGNFAYNVNRIVSLPYNKQDRNRQGGIEIYTGNGNEKIFVGGYQEGQEPGVLTGYVAEGIFQDVSEIPNNYEVTSGNAQNKRIVSPDIYNSLTTAERAKAILLRPGDVRWKDINGDGKIDQFDQVVFGRTTPRWTGGFNSTLSWRGLTLSARLDFALGFWRNNGQVRTWFLGNMQGTYNTISDVYDTWTPDNRGARYPRYVWTDQLGAGNYNRTSSIFVSRGDYLSFRELSLSYALPESILKKIAAKGIVLSVTAQNLGYLTAGQKVALPESGAGAGYSLPRTILFGLNITY